MLPVDVPLPFRSSYRWPSQVPELTLALAGRLTWNRAQALRHGVDIAGVGLATLDVYEQWYANPGNNNNKVDYQLQAALACAVACKWLEEDDPERHAVLLQMLDDVAEGGGGHNNNNSGQRSSFNTATNPYETTKDPATSFTAEGLKNAVQSVLGGEIESVRGVDSPIIEITFIDGDYGRGIFSGCLNLDFQRCQLTLRDDTNGETQIFTGRELPATDDELEEALSSGLWREMTSLEIADSRYQPLTSETLRQHDVRQPDATTTEVLMASLRNLNNRRRIT